MTSKSIQANANAPAKANAKAHFAFKGEFASMARKEIAKYPPARKASAVIALLHLAQKQNTETNHITPGAIAHICEMLDMAYIRVAEVASFYTQFRTEPTGKYHLQLCGTVPCWLCGAVELKKAILDHLNIKLGETTEDGLFTVTEVECLGACVNAPVVQINDDYFERVTNEFIINLLNETKAGKPMPKGFAIGDLNNDTRGMGEKQKQHKHQQKSAK